MTTLIPISEGGPGCGAAPRGVCDGVTTRCLEVRGDAFGIVHDVGFIGSLTRC